MAATVVLALLALATAGPAAAQEHDWVRLCGEPGTPSHAPCLEAALGTQAARAALGLAAAGGSDLAGANSTLGWRIGSTPRLAFAVRGGMTRAPVARLGPVPAGDETTWLPGLRGDVGVGLFDGFSVAPTVGGILSVDLLGTLSWVATSGDDGFTGDALVGGGLGLRVGVVRESFTLPGVTVSVARRWLGETDVGNFVDDGGHGARFDNTVTSVRGVVGKDLFAIGFLAGAGWERYGGDVILQVSSETRPDERIAADDFDSDRMLFFGGMSWNFLVLQLSAEGGWADGFADAPGRSGEGFDPGRGTWFGALALRLVL